MEENHTAEADTQGQEFIDGLRALADLLEQTGTAERGDDYRHVIFHSTREKMLAAVKQIGGRWEKDEKPDDYFGMTRTLTSQVSLYVYTTRAQVCEKRVVGTEKVMVPAKDAPMVEVEREVVEWVCPPSVLAGAAVTAGFEEPADETDRPF